MNPIERLTQIFGKFPGIGPRQAKRFVYFLLSENPAYVRELTETIGRVRQEVGHCPTCFRLSLNRSDNQCDLCRDTNRDTKTLMVVAKDIDLENIARSGEFEGRYFILGGLLPILEKNPEQKIRIRELASLVKKMVNEGLEEVVLALSANPEGDNTAEYVRRMLTPMVGEVKITVLGRGLSTGTELEYSDADTIKNALRNRG